MNERKKEREGEKGTRMRDIYIKEKESEINRWKDRKKETDRRSYILIQQTFTL